MYNKFFGEREVMFPQMIELEHSGRFPDISVHGTKKEYGN